MQAVSKNQAEKEFRDSFERLYLSHYAGMVRFAEEYVCNRNDAENIVQDAFAELWETRRRYFGKMHYPVAFLFTAVKNKCIDCLRHRIVVRETETKLQEEFRLSMQMKFDSLEALDEDDLASESAIEERLRRAIEALPEKCREIFIKSKLEGMKQKQIACELGISVNTVETQMGVAYKKLKIELKDCLPLFLFFLSLFNAAFCALCIY